MPSARDHPFNQSRRPLLELNRSDQLNNNNHELSDDEDDYADICNNNRPPTNSHIPTTAVPAANCNFKTYGFTRKFGKNISNQNSDKIVAKTNVYNGFNDFNSIPRVPRDDGYPYGEKIINNNDCHLTGFRDNDFVFSDNLLHANNHKNSSRTPTPQQFRKAQPQEKRKLTNQELVYQNQLNGNCKTNEDYRCRPLPKTPTTITTTQVQRRFESSPPSPPFANSSPKTISRTTPHRTGPFVFGVDSSITPTPTTRRDNIDNQPVAVIVDNWKYSNLDRAVHDNNVTATSIRRKHQQNHQQLRPPFQVRDRT